MKKTRRNMKMWGFKISFQRFLNTFLAGCLKLGKLNSYLRALKYLHT